MAHKAPRSLETEQIQFKLNVKKTVFQRNNALRSQIDLLAVSSNYGLIFIGDPNIPELKVVPVCGLINPKTNDSKILARPISFPSPPNCLAVSCDGSMIAVNYNLATGSFLSIYSVPSCLTANIQINYANIPLTTENNVSAVQILWNPVMNNTIAIILSNGALVMFNLKEGNYELFALDKSEQAKCASWSPKGKQIVVGFPNGKFIQFKPDLKLARTILCPGNVHDGPFDTIAIQWLSTYQFAASFLQYGDDMTPCLYIINAPKAGNPVYINYYDICFSASGPRIGQIYLIHVQAWNLLLVASANSMEVGVLGTTESGDLPNWFEYTMIDDSVRLSLPMSRDKEETYPIGIALDTGSSHQLTMNENHLPVMPMVHVLSTDGQLVSFDFLNLIPNIPGICSPANVISNGLEFFNNYELEEKRKQTLENNSQLQQSLNPDISAVTSTPASKSDVSQPSFLRGTITMDKITSNANTFGQTDQMSNANVKSAGFQGLGQLSMGTGSPLMVGASQTTSEKTELFKQPAQILFGNKENVRPAAPTAEPFSPQQTATIQDPSKNLSGIFNVKTTTELSDKTKPLYTVPPTFQQSTQKVVPQTPTEPEKKTTNNFTDPISSNVIQEMINTEIECFQLELNQLSKKSKNLDISIDNINETKHCTKRLNDLEEINQDAKENCFEMDVQILRHSVNECFGMISELESKLEMFQNPDLSMLATSMSGSNQSSRRQLAKLNSYIVTNKIQLKLVEQQLNSNWSTYQDMVQRNSKSRMHIPNLEGIYQTLSTQKSILQRERKKLEYFKTKLTLRDFIVNRNSTSSKEHININSLADSFLTISLSDSVKHEKSRLSHEKMQAIRDSLKCRKIITIKPKRPERLKSEVIMESKMRIEKERTSLVKSDEKTVKAKIENTATLVTAPIANKPLPTKSTLGAAFQPQAGVFNLNSVGSAFSDVFAQNPTDSKSKGNVKVSTSVQPLAAAAPATFCFKNEGFAVNSTNSLFGNKQSSLGEFASVNPLESIKEQGNQIELGKSISANPKSTLTFPASTITAGDANKPLFTLSTGSIMDPKNSIASSRPSTFSLETSSNVNNSSLMSQPSAIGSAGNLFSGKNINSTKTVLSFTTPTTATTTELPMNQFSGFSSISSANIGNTSSLFAGLGMASPNKENDKIPPLNQETVQTQSTTATSEKSLPDSSSNSEFTSLFAGHPKPTNPAKSTFGGFLSGIDNTTNKKNIFSGFENKTTSSEIGSATGTATATTTAKMPSPFSGFSSLSSNLPESTQLSFSGFGSALPSAIITTSQSASATIVSQSEVKPPIAVQSQDSNLSLGTLNLKPKELQAQPSSPPTGVTFGLPSTSAPNTSTISSTFNSGISVEATPQFPKGPEPVTEPDNKLKDVNSSSSTVTSSTVFSGFSSPVQTSPLFSSNASVISPASPATKSFGSLGATVSSTPTFLPAAAVTTATPFAPASQASATPFATGSPLPSVAPLSFGNPPAETRPNIFSSPASNNSQSGSIFSGIAKPEQNVFGSAAPAPAFGSQATLGGSIFTTPNTNIFSSAMNNQSANAFGSMASTGSVFGGGIKSEPANIFDTSSNQQLNGGSIFGQQSTGFGVGGDQQLSQTGSIFGDSSAGNSVGFGSGSIFGGSNQNATQNSQFGNPIESSGFGTGLFSTGATSGGSPFSGVQQNVNRPFSQSPGSVAQTGFGSMNSSFAKPSVFGGAPAFNSPPAFGGTPAFGGPATFGTFGSAQTSVGAVQTPFASPQQKNNLFEELGSSGEAVSFGNLAQNVNQDASKLSFVAGTSFTSWR